MPDFYSLAEAATKLGLSIYAVRRQPTGVHSESSASANQRVVTAAEIERYAREHKGKVGQPRKRPHDAATSD